MRIPHRTWPLGLGHFHEFAPGGSFGVGRAPSPDVRYGHPWPSLSASLPRFAILAPLANKPGSRGTANPSRIPCRSTLRVESGSTSDAASDAVARFLRNRINTASTGTRSGSGGTGLVRLQVD
jgi:hypothetical protein